MKSGYISIIGKPNVGKSTLLNRLLAVKLAIVSSKPQTTRNRILGILTEGDHQCYFLDTPGIIQPSYELQMLMVSQIKRAVQDADIIVWMVDPWFQTEDFNQEVFHYIKRQPIICVINKIDLIPKSELLPIIEAIKNQGVREIIPISALTGDGIEDLKKTIFHYLPESPFLYSPEDLSDSPERFFVAELVRERVFDYFKKEIPYATAVIIDEFKEREKGKDYIRAIIYVERKSQKAILIGKNGEALKKVGEAARKEIEDFLGREIYLDLWVKVREKWRKDKKFLKELGY
ncbi:MAG: GTPase Era [candidate division WOR-3 bacterium]|nr:MAG: GTPase Era [candidate division WOR-3 bacterium]